MRVEQGMPTSWVDRDGARALILHTTASNSTTFTHYRRDADVRSTHFRCESMLSVTMHGSGAEPRKTETASLQTVLGKFLDQAFSAVYWQDLRVLFGGNL